MSEETTLTTLSQSMADAVDKAAASTVMVDGRERFPASGIVYAADLILTANHVLERNENVTVFLPDGAELAASVAGRDPGNDLALLRLENATVELPELADGPGRVGQLVMALGRPTLEGIQASLGIVSAVGGPVRTHRGGLLEGHIRTDAIPYPGFSGGPLMDAAGRVLGINTSGLGMGQSLAIPTTVAWRAAASLAEHGSVKRGFLGIRAQPVEVPAEAQKALGREQPTGLLLVGVEDGSPAAEGGLMVGDILVGIGGGAIFEHDELLARLAGDVVGQSTSIEIVRGGQRREVSVTVAEREEQPHRGHGRRRMFWRQGHHGRGGR
ncbi:MAG: trypsin-like peptidase domain-containing protein [Anaerolineales bacterium]|nr:trypsin-like peptidase domain-containing protein [Anaerolineales bacterium]